MKPLMHIQQAVHKDTNLLVTFLGLVSYGPMRLRCASLVKHMRTRICGRRFL